MRCLAAAFAAAAVLAAFTPRPAPAGDDSWVYRRSYFSHVLPPDVQAQYPVPDSRSAYRIPYVDTSPGFGVRGIYRYNPVIIYDGRANDVTIYRQFWLQFER